jgi:crotonobetainyl-CoA:carnitine CoA-transferase CaiB-like acyl-CoA transferase
MSRTICDGLQVIEMGAGSIGASFAGMVLADNGARVIKVEPPEGDRLRHGHPTGFLVWNRGKESLVADLRTDDGRAHVRDLAANADVLIEGFRPGVADSWGLGYEQLRSANPGLVHCSVNGFGASGPYSRFPAYEGIVAAKAGVYSLGPFGYRSGPIFVNAPLGSVGAGHLACSGILAALVARERTGRGQHVEATILQGFNPLDYFGTMTWQHTQRATGDAHGTSATGAVMGASRYSFFVPTQDGRWVIFTQMLPHQAHALSRAAGIEHTITDPRFDQQPQFATAEDAQAWEDLLWEAMAQQPYEHWEKAFLADPDIAFELARFSEEGLDHEQIRHNGEAVTVEDADLGPVEQVGPVARFAETPSRIERSAPRLGEHRGEPFEPRTAEPVDGPALAHPLDGITIVELGYFYAMPYGVTMTAALGARVIKLEGAAGDPMRNSFGAAETGGAKTMEGKESLAVDLQTPEGQEIVREAAARADVFVNGFRTGVAERMGLDHATLSARNPRLVYVHAAGYGVDGPYAHRPIYAQVAQAIAGSIGRYGGRWLEPEFTRTLSTMEAQIVVMPRIRGIVDGDSNAALAVLSSLLLALYEQRRTGRGQFLSTTMIGGNAMAYADDFVRYAGKPVLAVPDEENHGLHALYRLYRAGEGWIFLAAPRPREWVALVEALGRPDLTADERFASEVARREHDDELVAVLADVFATDAAAMWEKRLTGAGVACVEAFGASHSEFTCTDPVLRETGLVVEVDHPLFGPILRAGPPVGLSETPGRVAPGCLVGQHTESILAELGYAPERIDDLRATGTVFGRPAESSNGGAT